MHTPPRFYCPIPLLAHTRVALPDAAAHHASRALRLREGDAIVLFNGDGTQFPAQLRFEQGRAMADLGPQQHTRTELPGRIGLVQGLPSGDKMDWIIEKAAELGVSDVFPVSAERSIVQLSGNRLEKRQLHWQRIAESASEQSGRNCIVQVHPLQTLNAYLQQASGARGYLCHPEGERSLLQALATLSQTSSTATPPAPLSFRLLIGPEGGWSPQELRKVQAAGIETVTFGARILRTETAGLAMTAAAIATLGWL
ncbi:MAG: 16S rRNA (uracil(1498)-N(3))-methyltransferase [Advenella sp.]|uniref:Ribosomal RNA small subunit methyltransferase E n=1 Tax=Advenella kashmirensis TaxID=310575 RepID=A0A356LFC7_9BURK|nr:16S rRNA (uracil(1498)-N(3))-methyltransferase [Advenella sp. FME57]HBP29195.1 16S rRNA (uracil(1498)-N(3))-methyltransferase [Advenella kashmirensis]